MNSLARCLDFLNSIQVAQIVYHFFDALRMSLFLILKTKFEKLLPIPSKITNITIPLIKSLPGVFIFQIGFGTLASNPSFWVVRSGTSQDAALQGQVNIRNPLAKYPRRNK